MTYIMKEKREVVRTSDGHLHFCSPYYNGLFHYGKKYIIANDKVYEIQPLTTSSGYDGMYTGKDNSDWIYKEWITYYIDASTNKELGLPLISTDFFEKYVQYHPMIKEVELQMVLCDLPPPKTDENGEVIILNVDIELTFEQFNQKF